MLRACCRRDCGACSWPSLGLFLRDRKEGSPPPPQCLFRTTKLLPDGATNGAPGQGALCTWHRFPFPQAGGRVGVLLTCQSLFGTCVRLYLLLNAVLEHILLFTTLMIFAYSSGIIKFLVTKLKVTLEQSQIWRGRQTPYRGKHLTVQGDHRSLITVNCGGGAEKLPQFTLLQN